jgi:hypothetical protein
MKRIAWCPAGRIADLIFRFAPLAILLTFSSTLVRGAGFREDEVVCEEAVAHIVDCCPDFDLEGPEGVSVSCTYDESGCDARLPDLSADESACIRELSCDELKERGICEYRARPAFSDPDTEAAPVCL